MPVECGQRLTIPSRRGQGGLIALLGRPVQEGRAHVKPLGAAIGSGQLPVDEDAAAGILTPRRLRVRRNQPVHQSFDGSAFLGSEIDP